MDSGNIFFPEEKPKIVGPNYDNSRMSRKDFLKVLLTELQWQDPLKAESVSDLINNSVKLREMEVLNNFETNVDKLVGSLQSASLFYASNFIGKTITYKGNVTLVKDGKGVFYINLQDAASEVEVVITDQNGNVVDRKTFYNLEPGEYPIEIDLPDGYYTISALAKDSEGNPIEAEIESKAEVIAVKREGNDIFLETVFGKISLDNLIGIGG
jgi:flagellar basal-body rod modification protein FlgD